jgi:hypothetical protein
MKRKNFVKVTALFVTFFFFATHLVFAGTPRDQKIILQELLGELPPPSDPWDAISIDPVLGIKYIPGETGTLYFPSTREEVQKLKSTIKESPEEYSDSKFIYKGDVVPVTYYLEGWNSLDELPDIDFVNSDLNLVAQYIKSEKRWVFFSDSPDGQITAYDSRGSEKSIDPSTVNNWANSATKEVKQIINRNFSTVDQLADFLGIGGSGSALAATQYRPGKFAQDCNNYKPMGALAKWSIGAGVVVALGAVVWYLVNQAKSDTDSKDTKKLNPKPTAQGNTKDNTPTTSQDSTGVNPATDKN